MGESTSIGCQPQGQQQDTERHSNDFSIIQLPKSGRLIWHIITLTDEATAICFNVKEHHTYKEDSLRFQNIKDGTVTDYMPYRNLYIANVKNATGYFIVRVEACE